MQLLNKEKTDLSIEGYVSLAIVMEMIYASEILAYQLNGAMANHKLKDTMLQRKFSYLQQAKRHCDNMIKSLEIGFDDVFNKMYMIKPGEEMERTRFLQHLANDVLRVLFIYYSRGDGSEEKRQSMQKALMNYKPSIDMELEEVLKFYHL